MIARLELFATSPTESVEALVEAVDWVLARVLTTSKCELVKTKTLRQCSRKTGDKLARPKDREWEEKEEGSLQKLCLFNSRVTLKSS